MALGTKMVTYRDLQRQQPMVIGGELILLEKDRTGNGGIRLLSHETANGERFFEARQGGKLLARTSFGTGQATHGSLQSAWNAFVKKLAQYAN